MKKTHSLLTIIFITVVACAQQTESEIKAEEPTDLNYTAALIVPDLEIPWGMVFLPDGSMLITEKSGDLIHFKDGTKTNIEGTPEVYVRGQGGFLDIVSGGVKFKLATKPADEFPSEPTNETDLSIEIQGSELARMISSTGFAIMRLLLFSIPERTTDSLFLMSSLIIELSTL